MNGDEFIQQVGQRIRQLRTEAGMTQALLAEKSGISNEFISRVERGLAAPSLLSLRRIADGLAIPIGELFVFDAAPADPHLHGFSPAITEFIAETGTEGQDVLLRVARFLLRSRTG